MKIEIDNKTLAKLLQAGVMAPSELRCLDELSKQQLKQLCLEMCKPSQCAKCDAHAYCAQVKFDALKKELKEEINAPTLL